LIERLNDATSDRIKDIETAWAEEITGRARRVLSGDSAGTPWEEVHRNIEGSVK
jgi:Putative addiction module component